MVRVCPSGTAASAIAGCVERPIRFVHRGQHRGGRRRGHHAHAAGLAARGRCAAPAPRKAAPRATAAPAPWWSASSTRRPGGVRWRTVNACIQLPADARRQGAAARSKT
ncbi:MAG: hypothetical protein MZW92_56535 [Comamonadaceae bacterium]|nr:hypothetical protein [Comamonadaceae bacterium]